jgi:hypothetical protein
MQEKGAEPSMNLRPVYDCDLLEKDVAPGKRAIAQANVERSNGDTSRAYTIVRGTRIS